jgi:hypothetical protein
MVGANPPGEQQRLEPNRTPRCRQLICQGSHYQTKVDKVRSERRNSPLQNP